MSLFVLIVFFLGLLLGALLTLIVCLFVFNKKDKAKWALLNEEVKATFNNISKDSLYNNANFLQGSFLESIGQILIPLKDSLKSMDDKVGNLEVARQGAYSSLREQIENLIRSQSSLQKETKDLKNALSSPTIKGRWGEMQLKRCVEISGLSSLCDFVEQKTISSEDNFIRPDLIITLPKNKKIIVDAKAPLDVCFNEKESDEKSKNADLAISLKRHVQSLKKKKYFKFMGGTPEFVVMFLPSDSLLSRALSADPLLLDFSMQNEVLIATPATLIAILKSTAFSLRQEAISHNVEEVRKLSQQLIDRIHKVTEHFVTLGKNLKMSIDSYNQTLASLDSRVLVTAKKLADIKGMNMEENITKKTTPELINVQPKVPKEII